MLVLGIAVKFPLIAAAANGCAPGLPAGFCQQHDTSSCVARNGFFCADWAAENFDRYTTPLLKHIELVAISVVVGFLLALGLAVLSHRHRWLIPPLTGITGALYTVPSLAFFFLLLPITGFGTDTAVIALSAYTVQILYRNINAGLANVPTDSKDAGRGMGMTERQLLWRVELPLAVPEIVAGLRIATVSTVAIATLAAYAGAGGLGEPIIQDINFKTNIIIAGGLAIALAIALDLVILGAQRLATPWQRQGQA
jgi:osmoprotectant transport system permease protein